jgi:tRNA A37 threonylcarbamoyladenosine synthetase subunit TsaC/SUA5/YrdC
VTARDVQADAKRLLDTIERGGVALFPVDVGYAIVGNHEPAIERIFKAKERSYEKQCGMFSNFDMVKSIAKITTRELGMIEAVIHGAGLPLSIVVPFDAAHQHFAKLTPRTRTLSSRGGTIDMLLNAGALHDAIAKLSFARATPVLGSSANQSLTGSKYKLGDVEAPVRAAADLVIDYGSTKYSHPQGMGSSIIELPSGKPIRKGIKYDEICDILVRGYGVDPRKLG